MNARANQKRNTEPKRDAPLGASVETASGRDENPATTDQNVLLGRIFSLKVPHLLCLAFIVAFIDQVTKTIVVYRLYLHESISVISGFFFITRIHNTGIAFGLFPNLPDLFMVVNLISILVVLYFYLTVEIRSTWLTVGCGLILGGATGNLWDRFRLGYVVDFINFSFWPAFNVADSAVSVGVVLLLISFFCNEKGIGKDASNSI